MSLVGRRPRSLDDLPPKKAIALPRAGDCFYCRTALKTATQAQMHRCDVRVGSRGGSLECNPGAQAVARRL